MTMREQLTEAGVWILRAWIVIGWMLIVPVAIWRLTS